MGLALTSIMATPAHAATVSSESLKNTYTKKLASLRYSSLTVERGTFHAEAESKISTAMNADRVSAGRKAMTRSAKLDSVARAWAKKMGGKGTLAHNPNYSTQIPSGWYLAAENVAMNGNRSDTAGIALYYQWMRSDGHRNNILEKRLTHAGFGVYVDTKGQTWGVQVFAQYPAGKSPDVTNAKVSGFSTSTMVKPSTTVTWSNVKLSHSGYLQQYKGGKWVTIKTLKSGTNTVKIKASSSYSKSVSYRIRIASTSTRKGVLSSTVKVRTQAQAKISNLTNKSSVSRSKTFSWSKVKLTHAGELQRYTNGKWRYVKDVKAGTTTVSTKAPSTKGTHKYRIYIHESSKNSYTKKTVEVRVK